MEVYVITYLYMWNHILSTHKSFTNDISTLVYTRHTEIHVVFSFVYTYRVLTAVTITARSVSGALYGAPDASDAYESSEKVLSVVNSKDSTIYQNTGQKEMVRYKQ